ncbi:hypothetical protein TCAL_16456 [Tigriopus californicus]|uniref:Uncharacterized protein n=1 Tax=Tigriopus californicus TaxID=6832 RepID=A0A553NZY6_TIGCA|nr:hypothetical protein TCAL_16456 [Tigriopus californicus]
MAEAPAIGRTSSITSGSRLRSGRELRCPFRANGGLKLDNGTFFFFNMDEVLGCGELVLSAGDMDEERSGGKGGVVDLAGFSDSM